MRDFGYSINQSLPDSMSANGTSPGGYQYNDMPFYEKHNMWICFNVFNIK
jgi:hypothetical protein